MRFQIHHSTTYTYSQPVLLQPHWIRLRPRVDGVQTLETFAIQVSPQPLGLTEVLDAEGNTVIKVWFPEVATGALQVAIAATVKTDCDNPFTYLLEPWATHLPLDYPMGLMEHLRPYLGGTLQTTPKLSSDLMQVAYQIQEKVNGNVGQFATEVNQLIYQTCQYVTRETGEPWPAGLTWARQVGSCRDLSVVFIEICRFMGLAARFVSGYQVGDPENPESHLHAWAEVYLPGAGWRGYDPTLGLAIADGHVALMASAVPQKAAPISGHYRGVNPHQPATTNLNYILQIQTSA